MKTRNYIIEKLQNAGYCNYGDNRSYEIRSLNSLIELGIIDFKFVSSVEYNDKENGVSFWFNSKDKRGNCLRRCTAYKVEYFGKPYFGHFIPKTLRRNLCGLETMEVADNSSLNIFDILVRVSRIISKNRDGIDFLKSEIFSSHGECSCGKCHGTGFLPQFSHIADGICFDCAGTGIDRIVLSNHIHRVVYESKSSTDEA